MSMYVILRLMVEKYIKKYLTRSVLHCIYSNNILKNHMWINILMLQQYKLYCRCFMLNFMNIVRTDLLRNTKGGVFLDMKSVACTLGLIRSGSPFWHFLFFNQISDLSLVLLHYRRLIMHVYMYSKKDNSWNTYADQYKIIVR